MKEYKYDANGQIVFELEPNAKQVDFNSEEMRKELELVKQQIKEVMECAKIDTSKLHIKFHVIVESL